MDPKPDLETACLEAIRHWHTLPQLAEFATQRHGYSGGEGVFGLECPSDLDEYDRVTRGQFIPPGYLRIYGWWWPQHGEGYEVFVPETFYLRVLARVLTEEGHATEAQQVQQLLAAAARIEETT